MYLYHRLIFWCVKKNSKILYYFWLHIIEILYFEGSVGTLREAESAIKQSFVFVFFLRLPANNFSANQININGTATQEGHKMGEALINNQRRKKEKSKSLMIWSLLLVSNLKVHISLCSHDFSLRIYLSLINWDLYTQTPAQTERNTLTNCGQIVEKREKK